VAKRSSSKGKGKRGRNIGKTVDPVTGRYIQETEGGITFLLKDDIVYHHSVGKWETESDWSNASDDSFIPLKSAPVDINGVLAVDGTPIEHPDAIMQVQLGDHAIVIDNSRGTLRQRDVYIGDFRYDKKGRLLDGRVDYNAWYEESPSLVNGSISKATDSAYRPFSSWDNYMTLVTNDEDPSPNGLMAIRAFGGGKYFYEGWQKEIFNPVLV
jgi:hypothetical protein